jgi:hypothetical protein
MRSVLAGLRNLVIPWGAALTAAAMEILTTPPAAIATISSGTQDYIGGIIWRFANTVSDTRYHFYAMYDFPLTVVRGTYDLTHGVRVFERIGTNPASNVVLDYGDASLPLNPAQIFRWGNANLILTTSSTWTNNGTAISNAIAYNSDGAGTPETWHLATLNAPWTNRGAGFPKLSYRLVASPPNSLQITGQLTVGGAASGSVVTTLPAGYTPLTAVGSSAGNDGFADDVLIELETNGQLKAFCASFGTHIQVNMVVPLDL